MKRRTLLQAGSLLPLLNGVTLARELSTLAQGIEDLRYQSDKDIVEAVAFVNTELEHLYTLNRAINSAYAMGSSTAPMRAATVAARPLT